MVDFLLYVILLITQVSDSSTSHIQALVQKQVSNKKGRSKSHGNGRRGGGGSFGGDARRLTPVSSDSDGSH